jgi:hypothetical protein
MIGELKVFRDNIDRMKIELSLNKELISDLKQQLYRAKKRRKVLKNILVQSYKVVGK